MWTSLKHKNYICPNHSKDLKIIQENAIYGAMTIKANQTILQTIQMLNKTKLFTLLCALRCCSFFPKPEKKKTPEFIWTRLSFHHKSHKGIKTMWKVCQLQN